MTIPHSSQANQHQQRSRSRPRNPQQQRKSRAAHPSKYTRSLPSSQRKESHSAYLQHGEPSPEIYYSQEITLTELQRIPLHTENLPRYPPLEEDAERKALDYIMKCELKCRNRSVFQDFENQLLLHIESRTTWKQPFTHTIYEYVILEVVNQNMREIMKPPPLAREGRHLRRMHWEHQTKIRLGCRFRWGATPKYHAKIYRNRINDALEKAGIYNEGFRRFL